MAITSASAGSGADERSDTRRRHRYELGRLQRRQWSPVPQLPYADTERLISISTQDRRDPTAPRGLVHFPDVETWQRDTRTLEGLAAAAWGWEWNAPTLFARGEARRITTVAVSETFFSVVGATPLIGRTFGPGDASTPCVLVLSHQLWVSLSGNDSIVGKSVELNERPCLVIGVMPPAFVFHPPDADAWMLISPGFEPAPESLYVAVFARLRAGVTSRQAEAELRTLYGAMHAGDRDANTLRPVVHGVRDEFTFLAGSSLEASLWLAFGAVGLLLVIACLNVAGVFSARMIAGA